MRRAIASWKKRARSGKGAGSRQHEQGELQWRCQVKRKRALQGCKCAGINRHVGVSRDEWVTQLLRQGDAKVFKKYSQMKLQMKREALEKLNRHANESGRGSGTVKPN
jgi:hypothetical protein